MNGLPDRLVYPRFRNTASIRFMDVPISSSRNSSLGTMDRLRSSTHVTSFPVFGS